MSERENRAAVAELRAELGGSSILGVAGAIRLFADGVERNFGPNYDGWVHTWREWADRIDTALVATPESSPPTPGDIQRRCWSLYVHLEGNGQCRLYNGHDGECDYGVPA